MKKFAIKVLLLLAVCSLCALGALFGCSGKDTINDPENTLSYNSFIDYSFMYTDSDLCPNGNITEDKLHQNRSFECNKINYIVALFTLNSPNQNGWNASEKFNVCFSISPCNYISTILEEASTSNYSESVKGETKKTTLTYSVPDIGNGQYKTYRVAIAFSSEYSVTAEIDLSFCLEGEDMENAPVVADFIAVGASEYSFSSYDDVCSIYQLNTYGNAEYLYIPDYYKNKRITRIDTIGDAAVKKIRIPDSVTSIGDYAFRNCSSLTDITLPSGVKSIGSYAFEYCSGLTDISIPSGVESIGEGAFCGCSSLTSITIPSSVTVIGEDAFVNCGLKSVHITDLAAWCKISFANYGSSPMSYGIKLYLNNEQVTELIVPDGVTSIGDYAFNSFNDLKSVTIGNGATLIGDFAFYNCDNLNSVIIEDSVTSIGMYAFNDCDNLYSVTIGKGVTNINDFAFCDCFRLVEIKNLSSLAIEVSSGGNGDTEYFANREYTEGESYLSTNEDGYTIYDDGVEKILIGYDGTETELTLPSDITEIRKYAFCDCVDLTGVTIPASVTRIGSKAFYGCSNLKSITIPEGITEIAFLLFCDCSSLAEITIPDSVTSIDYGAFYNCDSLKSITIPDSVTDIDHYAFYGCRSLGSVTISSGLKEIKDCVFYGCDGLTGITIPSGVRSIGDKAFYDCYRLVEIQNLSSLSIKAGSESNGYVGYYAKRVYNAGESYLSTDENGYIIYDDGNGKQLVGYTGTEKNLTLPDGITRIAERAFYNCTELTSVTIPDSVKSIGEDAFDGCYHLIEVKNLSSLSITAGGVGYGKTAFFAKRVYKVGESHLSTNEDGYIIYDDGANKILVCYDGTQTDLTLPGDITQIYMYAFYNCVGLTGVIIPDGVTSVDEYAFCGCTNLTYVIFSNSNTASDCETVIGNNAFDDCRSLMRVTLGNNITNIRSYAFRNCTSLRSIKIPYSVKSIGNYAFTYCTKLTEAYFGSTSGWKIKSSGSSSDSTSTNISGYLYAAGNAALCLTKTYSSYYWTRG